MALFTAELRMTLRSPTPTHQNHTMKTKHILCIVTAAALPACSSMEGGPFVNEQALQEIGDTLHRAKDYEQRGYSSGDAWDTARRDNFGGFSPMGGMTPIVGYGWGINGGCLNR